MDQGSVARLHSEAVTNSICSVPLQIHRALIPDPLSRYMYSREPVTMDQGSVSELS